MEINEVIRRRNIKSLVHFTRLENLDNILKNGIIPRASLKDNEYTYNDNYRYDNKLDYSCFSISFPNDKMFYTLRQKNQNTEWVVIELDTDLLKSPNCLFYPCNAASNSVSSDINLKNFQGRNALENMFYEEGRETYLPDDFPTDSQAEVMIQGIITPTYFKSIIMSNQTTLKNYQKLYPRFIFKFYPPATKFFASRKAFIYGY